MRLAAGRAAATQPELPAGIRLGRPALRPLGGPMARRVRPAAASGAATADPRPGRPRRVATIAGIAGLALIAFIGAFNPLPAAGGATTTDGSSTVIAGAAAAGSVWDGGMGFDVIDLAWKCGLVVVLLFITLRVLGRMQATGKRPGGRLEVLESRPLASKASLHLVAIGERRLVVGLTPNGMVSLAELKADELQAGDFAAELAAQQIAAHAGGSAGSRPLAVPALAAGTPLAAVLAPVDAVAARIASLLSGARAR
jgi:flagellar biogenesis protein FliO